MKRLFVFFAIVSVLGFIGCDDKDKVIDEQPPAVSVETTAEFDNSSFGLYKGIIVGSSGTIKIQINNGNNVAKADIVMDGKSEVLTCSTPLTNKQTLKDVSFSGASSSFSFSVDGDGKNPTITNFSIEGHDNVVAVVLKETSSVITLAYQGTSTGGDGHTGVFNVVRNGNTYCGFQRSTSEQDNRLTFSVNGTVTDDGSFSGTSSSLFHDVNIGLKYSGKFVGDAVSGTWNTSWVDGGSNSGSFSSKKAF